MAVVIHPVFNPSPRRVISLRRVNGIIDVGVSLSPTAVILEDKSLTGQGNCRQLPLVFLQFGHVKFCCYQVCTYAGSTPIPRRYTGLQLSGNFFPQLMTFQPHTE